MTSVFMVSTIAFAVFLSSCGGPDTIPVSAPPVPAVELVWGNPIEPTDSRGLRIEVSLSADRQLKCAHDFEGDQWDFTGTSLSSGVITPQAMRGLEASLKTAGFFELPAEMFDGQPADGKTLFRLKATFGSTTHEVRIMSGGQRSAEQWDRLMKSVFEVLRTCPTMFMPPFYD